MDSSMLHQSKGVHSIVKPSVVWCTSLLILLYRELSSSAKSSACLLEVKSKSNLLNYWFSTLKLLAFVRHLLMRFWPYNDFFRVFFTCYSWKKKGASGCSYELVNRTVNPALMEKKVSDLIMMPGIFNIWLFSSHIIDFYYIFIV